MVIKDIVSIHCNLISLGKRKIQNKLSIWACGSNEFIFNNNIRGELLEETYSF